MNKQRKVLITITYNEMGIIIDTKAEEVAQPNLQPTCNKLATDCISRHAVSAWLDNIGHPEFADVVMDENRFPSAQPDGYVKIPETGIDDLSDGFHTFRQLYYQRMMLFAVIVKQNKNKAWKSLRHEDGELCFGGGWFIVGIDTPEGSYTYHYENKYFDLFDCEILDYGKHWDGHTEKDVTRLLSLPSTQPEPKKGKWIYITDGHYEYFKCDQCEKHSGEPTPFCRYCGADMRGEQDEID